MSADRHRPMAVSVPLAGVDLHRLPFNHLLRKLRESRHLRQLDLGSRAYMDASTISRLESGQHPPSASDVARLAAALRLTESEHDALRSAFEREVVKSNASRPAVLVNSLEALRLVGQQLDAVRKMRAGGRADQAIQVAEHLAEWIQLLARSAINDDHRTTLSEHLAEVLAEQYYGYRDHLPQLATAKENQPPELPPGMVEVAARLADLGLWQALEIDPTSSSSGGVALHAFRLGLNGIRLRRQGSLHASLVELTAAVASGHISGAACDLLALHSAHTMRNLGRFDEAERLYQRLSQEDGPYRKRAVYQLADLAFVRGRFQEALNALAVAHEDIHLHRESIRLVGHVHRVNALFVSAEEFYTEALQLARWHGSRAMEGKALTNIVQALCWRRPAQALEWSQEAIAVNESIGNAIELVKIHGAIGVAATVEAEGRAAIGRSRELARQIGYQGGLLFTWVAEAFRTLLAGASAAPERLRREVDEAVRRLHAHEYWLDVLDMWDGQTSRPRVSWLGGVVAARRRWHQTLQERR